MLTRKSEAEIRDGVQRRRAGLGSERGSVLIGVMVASLMIAASAAWVLHDALQASKLSRLPRLKAEMISVENQVRELAHSPTTYENCAVILSGDATPKGCTIRAGVFEALAKRVTGALCDVPDCGIIIDLVNLAANGTFSARVNYEGREQSMVGLVTIQVPDEVLQASTYACPDARPLFKGFDADGKLICAPLNGNLCNSPGQYVAAVNPLTLEVERCGTLPAQVSCPAGEIMSQYTWNGSGSQTSSCAPRLDPWAYFAYSPSVAIGGPAPIPAPDPDPVAPAGYTTFEYFEPDIPPPPPDGDPVDCIGAFGPCGGAACGPGTQTYSILVAAANGGAACPNLNGDTQACDMGPCPPPPVNCEGEWLACVGACGGMGTQTYDWLTTPQNGGAACPFADGATQACVTDPCPPEDCIGGWGACSQACSTAGSVGTQTYTISKPATGAGLACPFANGDTQACNNLPCPVVGRWCLNTPGAPYCGGNPINPSATCDPLTAGAGHVNDPGCGAGVFATDVYQCVDSASPCPPASPPPPPPPMCAGVPMPSAPGGPTDCGWVDTVTWSGPSRKCEGGYWICLGTWQWEPVLCVKNGGIPNLFELCP